MTLNNKKMIIVSVILAVSVVMLLVFMLLGVNMIFFRISSVPQLLNEYALVKKSEADLTKTQQTYYNTINSLKSAENEYNKQKNKYNSISDETINIIKEATTEETYNLEYMWIKLGNYAKKNNLEIVMVEPGGQKSSINTSSGATTTTTANNTTTKDTANKETTNKNNTNNTNNSTTKNPTTSNDPVSSNSQTSNSNETSNTSVLKIEVTGSYMNTSDFIFEVENDTSLRFKLDNISMDYVKDTTIKTTFDVKNITVNK